MKKATLASTAIWLAAALLVIAWQIAVEHWPQIAHGPISHAMTWLCIAIFAASLNLIKSVDRRELFPSHLNNRTRNALNIGNFVAGISAAVGFVYLAGAFGAVVLHSTLFLIAVTAFLVGVAFQAAFAIATSGRMAD